MSASRLTIVCEPERGLAELGEQQAERRAPSAEARSLATCTKGGKFQSTGAARRSSSR